MTEQHLITPPPELVEQLRSDAPQGIRDAGVTRELHLIHAAYRAGADQELEACCEYLTRCASWEPEDVQEFCGLRRPKPPSLKEQALKAARIELIAGGKNAALIIRALEALPDD